MVNVNNEARMDKIQTLMFFSLMTLNALCLHLNLDLKWKLSLFLTSLLLLILVFLASSLLTNVDTLIERQKLFEGGERRQC
jgi:uncharacterized protein (DUF58 family)